MIETMEALTIIFNASTEEQKKEGWLYPSHDQLWWWSEEIKLTDKELKRLDELGWFIEDESWTTFS